MGEALQRDSNSFFLNNLLMTVQFFENYDRDIEQLRQNWFKDFPLESHNKKCFYADSVFRLVGRNVKFSQRGVDKNLACQIHPLRIYISSDNVEAAYDPSALKYNEHNTGTQYQFTVKSAEESEKSGRITLVQFKRKEARSKTTWPYNLPNMSGFSDMNNSNELIQENSMPVQQSNSDEKQSRSKQTQNSIDHNNIGITRQLSGRKSSSFLPSADGPIPANGFYKYENHEARLKLKSIKDFRMNSATTTSHEIPMKCFQLEEVKLQKINYRRTVIEHFNSRKVLNAAAYKGYFCDLLIEELAESLHLDLGAVNESTVSDEFIIVNHTGSEFYVAPVIPVRDWHNFVVMNRKYRAVGKTEHVVWPSKYMQTIISLLPCNAVPTANSQSEENSQYEKVWTLVFPKAEEFLLLHMMHAHLRCYLFAVLLYKSFIEKEINRTSFGPKHLLHLLFWRVHKNFFAWPEDRAAETLICYLRILYRKLQNKTLCDFFIPSRNLFAGSLTKDLHKAQALIKKIIENPVLYITRAIRNLQLESNYYPEFDVLKLSTVLSGKNAQVTSKRKLKKRKVKRVYAQEDEELLGGKNAIKQIDTETVVEEKLHELAAASIDLKEKGNQVLEIFTSHFIQMGMKSLEYSSLSQALLYLNKTEELLKLMTDKNISQNNLTATRKQLNELKENCYSKLRKAFPQLSSKQFQVAIEKPQKTFAEAKQQEKQTINSSERDFDEDNEVTIKL